ncbi:TetR family transcriptional regulator [Mycobacterium gallinarum]|uniref:TetR family transcriptional regulator n=1 Tax=Mycobacterium gallinarum TaxID=39689 RepID=A0A9W4B7P5_9MYCO|nr:MULTISPECIES: TetR/AcrR family transcriptional regulator [Mycobacterium]MDV3135591.1 TetR/AcrR family transcriptional regulator [Mycobacterium sp. 29Ha]BBY95616.1 TetR family transcriptional regulator [Mycobacterium gallinarum]
MTPAERFAAGDGAQDARVARTRADVSRVALRVLTDEGTDALTHGHVAELAGYSKTTLYTHWPSRVDLILLALGAIGEMPHQERTGDLRADLVGELTIFRRVVLEYRLDQILAVMAQWASVDEMARVRDQINTDAQRPIRGMLAEVFDGVELEAAISMLAGVVACPTIMFGSVPDDDVIEAAVDLVLRGSKGKRSR